MDSLFGLAASAGCWLDANSNRNLAEVSDRVANAEDEIQKMAEAVSGRWLRAAGEEQVMICINTLYFVNIYGQI